MGALHVTEHQSSDLPDGAVAVDPARRRLRDSACVLDTQPLLVDHVVVGDEHDAPFEVVTLTPEPGTQYIETGRLTRPGELSSNARMICPAASAVYSRA